MKQATVKALSDLDAMWAAVDSARAEHFGQTVARPAGSFTVKEYSRRYGVSIPQSNKRLSVLVEKGSLQMLKAYVPDSSGRNAVANVYLPVAK